MSKIYNSILYSHVAREIMEDLELESEVEGAKAWFENVICDEEVEEQPMPHYHRYECEICEGWSMYYDYGADYYFAVKEED